MDTPEPSYGADVRRSSVVDVVVEEEERELGENADQEHAAGHTLAIKRQDDGVCGLSRVAPLLAGGVVV